jgi:hypothetical protein
MNDTYADGVGVLADGLDAVGSGDDKVLAQDGQAADVAKEEVLEAALPGELAERRVLAADDPVAVVAQSVGRGLAADEGVEQDLLGRVPDTCVNVRDMQNLFGTIE